MYVVLLRVTVLLLGVVVTFLFVTFLSPPDRKDLSSALRTLLRVILLLLSAELLFTVFLPELLDLEAVLLVTVLLFLTASPRLTKLLLDLVTLLFLVTADLLLRSPSTLRVLFSRTATLLSFLYTLCLL